MDNYNEKNSSQEMDFINELKKSELYKGLSTTSYYSGIDKSRYNKSFDDFQQSKPLKLSELFNYKGSSININLFIKDEPELRSLMTGNNWTYFWSRGTAFRSLINDSKNTLAEGGVYGGQKPFNIKGIFTKMAHGYIK